VVEHHKKEREVRRRRSRREETGHRPLKNNHSAFFLYTQAISKGRFVGE
jgi:hypothetical protein